MIVYVLQDYVYSFFDWSLMNKLSTTSEARMALIRLLDCNMPSNSLVELMVNMNVSVSLEFL